MATRGDDGSKDRQEQEDTTIIVDDTLEAESSKRDNAAAVLEDAPAAKRAKAADNEDDFALIPMETSPMDTTASDEQSVPLVATTSATLAPTVAAVAPGMNTGRDVTIKQEQFPVPLLDIEHFSNLPDAICKKAKRYLDEPHPTLKSPVSPFQDGKGSFSTGWWLAFHHYNRDLPEYANIRKDIICCNLCGAQVKRGERARATSALVQHLKTKLHRTVFDQLAVLWEGKARDPLVPRLGGGGGGGPVKIGGPRKSSSSSTTTPRVRKSDFMAQQQQMRAITHWIADTNQSMDIVETKSFRQLVQVLQETARHDVKGYTAKHVAQEMATLDQQVRDQNRAAMKGRVVWTTLGYVGTETSSVQQGYRYLTAHFISEEFEIKSLMLQAKEQAVDPKAHSMASEYLEDSTAWGMKPGLVYIMGDDVEVSNPGFVSSSTESSSSTLGAQIEKNKGLLHVNFMDQKLSSTAQVALDFKFAEDNDSTVPETRQVVTKARDIVAIFTQSSQRLADLKKMQEDLPGEYKGQDPLGVVQDSDEFWWTMHNMIDRLLKLRPALEKLWTEDRELDGSKMLDTTEWDILKQILIVLKPLVMGVKALENEKVTAPLALVALNMVRGELANIQAICEAGEDDGSHDALVFAPAIAKCATKLLEHFDKTWGSLEEPFQGMKLRAGSRNRQKGLHWSILMAYLLDPRFKALPHIPNENNKEAIWEAVLKEMAQVKKQLMKTNKTDDTTGASQGDGPKEGDNAMMMYMMNKASMEGRKGGTKGSSDENDQEIKELCTAEIDAYKKGESPPLYDQASGAATNPLDWWKKNHSQFPVLWLLAQVFLPIPVSAASLEKKFGKPGLQGDGGDPAIEMANERMNIKCNGLEHPDDSQGPPIMAV